MHDCPMMSSSSSDCRSVHFSGMLTFPGHGYGIHQQQSDGWVEIWWHQAAAWNARANSDRYVAWPFISCTVLCVVPCSVQFFSSATEGWTVTLVGDHTSCRTTFFFPLGELSGRGVLDSWSKYHVFNSWTEQQENFLLQGQLSVLTVILLSIPIPALPQ